MGWSFRRSFKAGPVRINLSKRGIGVSAGIPGLRIGKDAGGRVYTSAGFGRLRYRRSVALQRLGALPPQTVTTEPGLSRSGGGDGPCVVCRTCGAIGDAQMPGSTGLEILLWLMSFPGPIYSMWRRQRGSIKCGRCRSSNVERLTSREAIPIILSSVDSSELAARADAILTKRTTRWLWGAAAMLLIAVTQLRRAPFPSPAVVFFVLTVLGWYVSRRRHEGWLGDLELQTESARAAPAG
jgi:hypothetical protein